MTTEQRISELENRVNELEETVSVQNQKTYTQVRTIIHLTESLTLAYKLISENRELNDTNSCAVTELEERLNNLIGN